ncbi:PREDICTED: citrate synthase, mitochondrial-like [Camelina sativa]|uniref:Citrate synthase, mitochondrial-like n=1 Tax=Camelina sativa TaxID=90675 RepID=A0ABM1RRA5_CAMSA|nr:PREDICTED: citrate synthase, mitochondrial-like [Camelina sativa]
MILLSMRVMALMDTLLLCATSLKGLLEANHDPIITYSIIHVIVFKRSHGDLRRSGVDKWGTSLLIWEYALGKCRFLNARKLLPSAQSRVEPLPEGPLWLPLTAKVPSKEQVQAQLKELAHRAGVPESCNGGDERREQT